MPRGDGTGPFGNGPMTGRGLGPCSGNPSVPGRGRGLGLGQGRCVGAQTASRSAQTPTLLKQRISMLERTPARPKSLLGQTDTDGD